MAIASLRLVLSRNYVVERTCRGATLSSEDGQFITARIDLFLGPAVKIVIAQFDPLTANVHKVLRAMWRDLVRMLT